MGKKFQRFEPMIEALLSADAVAEQTYRGTDPRLILYDPEATGVVIDHRAPLSLTTKVDVNAAIAIVAAVEAYFSSQKTRYNVIGSKAGRLDVIKGANAENATDDGSASLDVIINPMDSTNNGLHGFPYARSLMLLEATENTTPLDAPDTMDTENVYKREVQPIFSFVYLPQQGEVFIGDTRTKKAYKLVLRKRNNNGRWIFNKRIEDYFITPLHVSPITEEYGLTVNVDDRFHQRIADGEDRIASLVQAAGEGKKLLRIFGSCAYQVTKAVDTDAGRGLGLVTELQTRPDNALPAGLIAVLAGADMMRWGIPVAGQSDEERRFFNYDGNRFLPHRSYAPMNVSGTNGIGFVSGNPMMVQKYKNVGT